MSMARLSRPIGVSKYLFRGQGYLGEEIGIGYRKGGAQSDRQGERSREILGVLFFTIRSVPTNAGRCYGTWLVRVNSLWSEITLCHSFLSL
jgi:hypothetical protein